MEKHQLKQEAKSLLLKQCYKMASNKYSRLIQMGAEGFTAREWAIIHLNHSICYQFLEQYDKALELSSRSIEIDPTYQKAYYRRIQILRDMGKGDVAINSVPSWINNKEISDLLREVREEYLKSLGIDQLLQEFMCGKETVIEHVKQSHLKFYQKLLERLQLQNAGDNWEAIGFKIVKYYIILKQSKKSDMLESFLSVLHQLSISQVEQPKRKSILELILGNFWSEYFKIGQPFNCQTISVADIKNKGEFKLIRHAPCSHQLFKFFSMLVNHPDIEQEELFETAVQMANNFISKCCFSDFSKDIMKTTARFVDKISESMCHSKLGWLKRSFLLTDALIRLHLSFGFKDVPTEMSVVAVAYLRYCYISKYDKQSNEMEFSLKIGQQKMRQYLVNNLQNFMVIFMFEQFIHRLDRGLFKEIIPAIEQQMDIIKDLTQILKQKGSKQKSSLFQMSKEYELVYTSIMLKIDLKHSNLIDISGLLSHKHNRKTIYDQSMSDMIMNTLLLLALSSKKNLSEVLNHPQTITNIIHQFVICTFTQQLQSLGTVIGFMYIVLVNVQVEQQAHYAKKMGVNIQQIEKARKLQGESQQPELNQQLNMKRLKFKEYAVKNWNEIIVNLSTILLKIKDDKTTIKWSKILLQIIRLDASRFHHPKIIEVMLESFKIDPALAGQFFSILLKKINLNLIKYEQIQPLSNVLVYNLQNGQHELVIFESLLGLINLTSNSSNQVKVPLKALQNCLFEENKYIIHGALELLNNVLIHLDKQQIDKQDKLKELVVKYISFYRDQVVNYQEKVPLTDYSHPSKVYSTLLSVAIVMDLDELDEFRDWKTAEKCLLRIQTPRAITFFKVAIFMGMKSRLKGKWWTAFQKELENLQVTNKAYWLKLKQYMK